MKIWYQSTLNFAHHPNYEKALAAHFKRIASPGTEVVLNGRSAKFGSELGGDDTIGSPIMYHSVVAPAFVRSLLNAEKAGADAFSSPLSASPSCPS